MTHRCRNCGAPLENLTEQCRRSCMMPDLAIKHMFPAPRRMMAEYRRMFSPLKSLLGLKVLACGCALLGTMWLILLSGPSTRDPTTNILLRIFAFFNAYCALGLSALLAFVLVLPLLTRLILPFGNLLVQIVKVSVCQVLFGVQYLLFDFLCEQMERLLPYLWGD